MPIASIGPAVDLTYPVERLGAGPATLRDSPTASAASPRSGRRPRTRWSSSGRARSPARTARRCSALARSLADVVRDDWNGFAVLHTRGGRVGGLDLGLVPGEGGRDVAGILAGAQGKEIEVVYLLAPTRSTARSSARPS